MDTTESIAAGMAAAALSPDIQLTQTAYRQELVNRWPVGPGSRVLEIGCGQGDMTAVLASAVGDTGHVLALDPADPSYGAPVTLGESAAHFATTPLGPRVEFRFGADPVTAELPAQPFDVAVLAHCTWYFDSLDTVLAVLTRARSVARMLCLAEWDLTPRTVEQLPHLLAVLVQGQAGEPEANVRTPFSRQALHRLLAGAGWRVTAEHAPDTSALADADWEVDAAQRLHPTDGFVASQLDVLRALALERGNPPLPSYAITAEPA